MQRAEGRGADWLARAEAAQPFGRLIKADDVARLTLFLLLADSGVMTGAVIDRPDGDRRLRLRYRVML